MRGLRVSLSVGLVLAWLVGIGVVLGAGASMPEGWRFTMMKGDPVAGEKAFDKMKCWSCHDVSGKRFGKSSDSPGEMGPALTRSHARLPREYLAESILNTDEFLAHGNYQMSYRAADGTSRMAHYQEVMTLQELTDIVEFIRTIR